MEFFDALSEFTPGHSEELQQFIERETQFFRPISLKKNEFLVTEGQICNYFCLIKNGILQHSVLVGSVEKTTYIGLKNSITTSLASFLNQKPSRKSIKALLDCDLLVIDHKNFTHLLQTDSDFSRLYFALIERQICLIDEYRIDLLTLSPDERYTRLLQTEPELLKKVPLHYLSSFLGISDRHMSRIRKNIR